MFGSRSSWGEEGKKLGAKGSGIGVSPRSDSNKSGAVIEGDSSCNVGMLHQGLIEHAVHNPNRIDRSG